MVQASLRWSASSVGTFRWRQWDDNEQVVYHTASGSTHVLSPPAAEILKALEHATLGFDEILQRVTILLGDAPDDGLAEQVRQLLNEFDQLGLIEPVP